MDLNFIKSLASTNSKSKVILLVMDGLGGIPHPDTGLTELETAKTPNLDKLAEKSLCGLVQTVANGITPGSGAGHLGLFGYDPIQYAIGRGVLSALGVDFDLQNSDVAARGNFCTIDDQGKVTDRRAGRISTEKGQELCNLLQGIKLPGVELKLISEKEHRFVFVLRGQNLCGDVSDTDPQHTGVEPHTPTATSPQAEQTAKLVQQFVAEAKKLLADHHPANMVLLRGLAMHPDWPQFPDVFGMRAAAVADYPMYRGVAKLVGMDILRPGAEPEEKFAMMKDNWDKYDFFFVHIKKTDSSGEDGDFARKVAEIEKLDKALPKLMDLNPDVVVVTGDHSTPAVLKAHSWHPVPSMIYSQYCRPDNVKQFGERACMAGGMGPERPATDLLPLALANALRLEKFGA